MALPRWLVLLRYAVGLLLMVAAAADPDAVRVPGRVAMTQRDRAGRRRRVAAERLSPQTVSDADIAGSGLSPPSIRARNTYAVQPW